jgi:hypothetical protein
MRLQGGFLADFACNGKMLLGTNNYEDNPI